MQQTISPFVTSAKLPAAVGIQAGRLCDFGFVMLDKHQYAQALERFDAVLSDEPNCVTAWFGRSRALQGMGRWALALADLQRAEALVGRPHCDLILWRAELLLGLRNYASAGEACQEVLALEPLLPKAQWLRLKLFVANGFAAQKSVAQQSWSTAEASVTAVSFSAAEFVGATVPLKVR